MATPKLAVGPNDPAYVGRVVSASRVPNDVLGTRYILILETLVPWGAYGIGDKTMFDAPGQAFWERARQMQMLMISRESEGGRIARYMLEPIAGRSTVRAVEAESQTEMLQGKDLKKKLAGAYQLAHETIDWYNQTYYGGKLPANVTMPSVTGLAHTLLIGHQRNDLVVPDFTPPKSK